MKLYLTAKHGLQAQKPKQIPDRSTGNPKKLNSCLYICGWILYIWGWLSASFSQLWSISFIHLSVTCLYKCGQFLYIWGRFIQLWLIFIHLREVLYVWGNLYIWRSNTGHNALFGMYSLMDVTSKRILLLHVLKVKKLRINFVPIFGVPCTRKWSSFSSQFIGGSSDFQSSTVSEM